MPEVLYETGGRVATLTLNRPQRLNAITATLVEDLRAALATDGPVVVDARVTREESVYPMIAPGAAARDMVG